MTWLFLSGPPQAWGDVPHAILEEAECQKPGTCPLAPTRPELSPDHSQGKGTTPLEASVRGAGDVLLHSGRVTDAEGNWGIISYMRQSLLSDDAFFEASYRFYKELRQKEGDLDAPAAIDDKAPGDVLEAALRAAKGDRYLALKVLALYGHDNVKHALGALDRTSAESDCRFQILDKLQPRKGSSLYRSGGIPALAYTSAQVDRGKQVAENCKKEGWMGLVGLLCNDSTPRYQADYYHVVTAAFLGCRRAIQEREAAQGSRSSLVTVMSAGVDAAYLRLVAQYKIDRFREVVESKQEGARNSKAVPSEVRQMLELVREGLERLAAGTKPALPAYDSWQVDFAGHVPMPHRYRPPRKAYDDAKAILDRYEFEIGFRVAQHEMGLRFGKSYCAEAPALVPACR